jgi:hypothetical protein
MEFPAFRKGATCGCPAFCAPPWVSKTGGGNKKADTRPAPAGATIDTCTTVDTGTTNRDIVGCQNNVLRPPWAPKTSGENKITGTRPAPAGTNTDTGTTIDTDTTVGDIVGCQNNVFRPPAGD